MKFYDCFVQGKTVSSTECFDCYHEIVSKKEFASRVLCQMENAMELDMNAEEPMSPAEEETF